MTTDIQNGFIFHFDAGHGWLKVHAEDLAAVGLLGMDKISKCSYVDGQFFYLEEDCDAPKFLKAYKEKFGKRAEQIEEDDGDNSPIRNMRHVC